MWVSTSCDPVTEHMASSLLSYFNCTLLWGVTAMSFLWSCVNNTYHFCGFLFSYCMCPLLISWKMVSAFTVPMNFLNKNNQGPPFTTLRGSFSIFISLTYQHVTCLMIHSSVFLWLLVSCFSPYLITPNKHWLFIPKALSSVMSFSLAPFSPSLHLATVIGSSSVSSQWYPNL